MKTTVFVIAMLSVICIGFSTNAQNLKLPNLYSIMEADNEFAESAMESDN